MPNLPLNSREQPFGPFLPSHAAGLIEAFVAQPAIDAFDEAVLHRFAGRDLVPFDAPFILPLEDGVRGQFCSLLGNQSPGFFSSSSVAHRPKSPITFRMRKSRPRERLSETKSSDQRWFGSCSHGCPCSQCPFPAAAFAHRRPFLLACADSVTSNSPRCLATGQPGAGVDNRTAGAVQPVFASGFAVPCHRCGRDGIDELADQEPPGGPCTVQSDSTQTVQLPGLRLRGRYFPAPTLACNWPFWMAI